MYNLVKVPEKDACKLQLYVVSMHPDSTNMDDILTLPHVLQFLIADSEESILSWARQDKCSVMEISLVIGYGT